MTRRKILASSRVTLALAIGFALAASFLPASGRMALADPGELEWTTVTTPSEEGLVDAPVANAVHAGGVAVGKVVSLTTKKPERPLTLTE